MDFRSERSLSRGARATETALPTKKMTKILRPRTFSFSYDRSPPHGRERSIQLDCFKNVARICQFLQARASYAPFLDFGAHIYIYSNGEGISSRRYPSLSRASFPLRPNGLRPFRFAIAHYSGQNNESNHGFDRNGRSLDSKVKIATTTTVMTAIRGCRPTS